MNVLPGFPCPKCAAPSLHVTLSMALGPDDHSDQRAMQILTCEECAFEGIGWYEESSRGADERVHHLLYDTTVTPMIKSTIEQCATPDQAGCQCFGHGLVRKCRADPNFLSLTQPIQLR